jgi:hypothetical protein
MFVAAEPFDDLLHLLVEERIGMKVSWVKCPHQIQSFHLLFVCFILSLC